MQESEKRFQLQKMQALGQFAGGIAHDFNNILSIIEGHTSIALRQLREGTLTPEQLQKILKSTQRGAGLTRQLLSFGRQKLDAEEKTNVVEALRQLHTLLRPLLGEMIQLFMTVPESPVWVNASQDQLTQMILNLAINARDAMPDGGELGIICMPCPPQDVPPALKSRSPQVSFIRITVVDSGEGIPPAVLPRIFEPFLTTKEQGKGTGLGLSVVYGLVEQLKGAIEVSSKAGEGASFDIFLPLVPPPALTLPDMPLTSPSLEGRTILIAEDEPELREILAGLFNGMQMKVLAACNGNQALALQDGYDGNIDFLLTDVVMPGMDGIRLGEMFREVRPQSSVIYMSGYPFIDGRKDLHVPDDAPFIRKPLEEGIVRRVLERALERQRLRLKKDGDA